jgi:hypothetical protein
MSRSTWVPRQRRRRRRRRRASACGRPPPGRPNWMRSGLGRRRTRAKATRSRRLPTVEVDPTLTLIGLGGPVPCQRCSRAVDSSWPGVKAVRSSTARSASSRSCMRATSPTPCYPRARTRRASATATSWAGRCRGTRRKTPPASCSSGAVPGMFYPGVRARGSAALAGLYLSPVVELNLCGRRRPGRLARCRPGDA